MRTRWVYQDHCERCRAILLKSRESQFHLDCYGTISRLRGHVTVV